MFCCGYDPGYAAYLAPGDEGETVVEVSPAELAAALAVGAAALGAILLALAFG